MSQEFVKGLPYRMTPFAIFDLDGTLIDSMIFWEKSDHEMLTSRGVVYDPVETTEATKALNVREAMQYWLDHFDIPDTLEELLAEANARITHAYATEVPLKPHVLEYLDYLKAQGVRMCVATSSGLEQVEVAMRRLDLWDRFEFVISAEDVGRGKEFPDIYLQAAQRLGAVPDQCTVFEDSLTAVKTAKGAGFSVVAVWDQCAVSYAEEIRDAADCYVMEMGQLM